MRKLNAGHGALRLDEPRDACQRLDVLVLPDPQVLRRNPSARLDGRGFGDHQRRATHRARTEVHEVPVGGEAIIATVLAHRRDADAVPKRDAAQGKRSEEVAHGERMVGGLTLRGTFAYEVPELSGKSASGEISSRAR